MLNIHYTTLHYYTGVTAMCNYPLLQSPRSRMDRWAAAGIGLYIVWLYRVHQSLACDYVWYLHGEYSMKEGISAFAILNKGICFIPHAVTFDAMNIAERYIAYLFTYAYYYSHTILKENL